MRVNIQIRCCYGRPQNPKANKQNHSANEITVKADIPGGAWHSFPSPCKRLVETTACFHQRSDINRYQVMRSRQIVAHAECLRWPLLRQTKTAAKPIPDCQDRAKITVTVSWIDRMVQLVLRRRNQDTFDDSSVAYPDMTVP